MGWWHKHKKQKVDKPIEARTLRTLAETADIVSRIQVSPPLGISVGFNGPIISFLADLFDAFIGITTTAITARSGTTPGSGTVKVQTWNGTVLADLGGPVTYTAYNWNSASGGISSAKYCVCAKFDGDYFIVAAEC